MVVVSAELWEDLLLKLLKVHKRRQSPNYTFHAVGGGHSQA